ncbi:MAG: penicillin-binding protein, partial [Deltaproteobacteria bacterium]|nr:penicillin-binding protein [Deltaproteobacteria bacterium]
FSFVNFFHEAVKALPYAARLSFKGLLIATILFIGLAGGYVYWCIITLPKIELLEEYSPYESSKLYSHDNMLLTEFYVERRTFIPHNNIPRHVKDAFIAAEDTRFYRHHGIDYIRILGALIKDIKKRAFVQGGSTITQQLAKRLFLKPEKTITRKIKEIALSFKLEKRYTKDEILGLYLNQAYFGTRAYGIEAACQAYFGASIDNITIPEAALLAALLKAPSKYSPFKYPQKALIRRNLILKRMFEMGFISVRDYKDFLADPIPETFHKRKYNAPYFVDYCRTVLEKKYGDRLYASGLRIYSTLDYRMQKKAERAVHKGIKELNTRIEGKVQAALLAIDLWNGCIRAMVGGANFWESQFNRVTQAKRQPGSAFKPIVYLTAFEQGFDYDDTILDKRIAYKTRDNNGTWTPRNH